MTTTKSAGYQLGLVVSVGVVGTFSGFHPRNSPKVWFWDCNAPGGKGSAHVTCRLTHPTLHANTIWTTC